MKNIFFTKTSTGHLFVITVLGILLLGLGLLSYSSSARQRHRFALKNFHKVQAGLNAHSGLEIIKARLRNNTMGGEIPYEKKMILFDDEKSTVHLSVDFVDIRQNDMIRQISRAVTSQMVRVIAIGEHYGQTEKIVWIGSANNKKLEGQMLFITGERIGKAEQEKQTPETAAEKEPKKKALTAF